MVATLVKISRSIFLLNAFASVAYGQLDCNKTALFKRDQKDVPAKVCIPKNYVITKVYTRDHVVDFNGDGRPDYVFAMERHPKLVGDSSYLVFYKMNVDSSHALVRKFGNLYPLWFDPNIETPNLKERRLIEAFECYVVPDPLYSLEIKSDSIKLTRKMDGQNAELIKYVYKFDSHQFDWKLIFKKRYSESNSMTYRLDNVNWLRDFSYCRE
jgi:hypothetical protein